MKTKVFLTASFVAALLAGMYVVPRILPAQVPDAAPASARQLPVFVVTAALDTVYDGVDALGTAYSMESVDITSNVTDRVQKIMFTDGQQVRKDDVIVVLEKRESQAQLAASRARLADSRRELQRLETLVREKAVSQQEYDLRQTALEVARREVEELEARISYRTIRAPFDGVLGIRRISVGTLVQPGDLITTLDDISKIKLDFTVPSTFLADLRVGMPVEAVAEALPGRRFRGEVDSVNTRIDPVTRAMTVRAVLPNEDGVLRPGLMLRVSLMRNEREAVVVPEESVLMRQREHFVLVVGTDDVVERRRITVGARMPGRVEVTSGLEAGERIVVRGISRVDDGDKVQVAEDWGLSTDPQRPQKPAGDQPE